MPNPHQTVSQKWIKFINMAMTLLNPPLLLTLCKFKGQVLPPIFNHITMDWNLALLIKSCVLITTNGKQIGLLNFIFGNYQGYVVHKIFHSSPTKSLQCKLSAFLTFKNAKKIPCTHSLSLNCLVSINETW
jgi:hypothetical protein